MIKANKGKVNIKCSNVAEMMDDYTNITRSVLLTIIEKEELTKEDAVILVKEAIALAQCDTPREIADYMLKRSLEMLEEMKEKFGEKGEKADE